MAWLTPDGQTTRRTRKIQHLKRLTFMRLKEYSYRIQMGNVAGLQCKMKIYMRTEETALSILLSQKRSVVI